MSFYFDAQKLISGVSKIFYQAVHENNYKNGTFQATIARDTPLLEIIDLFIASPLLNDDERSHFREARATLVEGLSGRWTMSLMGMIIETLPLTAIGGVFIDDMAARRVQITPAHVRSMGSTGNTTSSATIDHSGNAQTTRGADGGVNGGANGGQGNN